MIHKLRLTNFKRIKNETFEFQDFDLLVGMNNSGKSSILQALAIWQYCVDQFRRSKRTGTKGIQIVLPNFTALPLPEFVLLWNDKTERTYPATAGGKKTQVFILIEIEVFWRDENGNEQSLSVELRYQSPQSVYAKPAGGWANFKTIESTANFPQIVYVPPFSGLEPNEIWLDDANVRRNVGKAQPGSILRNLLYRVVDKDIEAEKNQEWLEIVEKTKEWFGVDLNVPVYEKGESIDIQVSYKSHRKDFDIISGGSGFHQILTLLAFLHGYPQITTILFDEPDAHLHENLQRQILSYFRQKKDIQFLIATHAEEFIRGVDVNAILSLLSGKPRRIHSSRSVIEAMSNLDNLAVVNTKESPYVLYVEGEDDERILMSWAAILGKTHLLTKFHFVHLGGGTKEKMDVESTSHFEALKQVNSNIKRVVLFDYDSDASFHPPSDNPVLFEWKRKNIENYLLVPDAWKLAVLDAFNATENLLFAPLVDEYGKIIEDFFSEQSIVLPAGFTWKNVSANIFEVLDGKRILFRDETSLFQRLRKNNGPIINRERVAANMTIDLLHKDIEEFFQRLSNTVSS